MLNERVKAIIVLLIVLISMSFATILMKIALAEIAPLTLAWTTVAVGMVVMYVYTFVVRRERIPANMGRRVWYYLIAIGLCNFVISKITRPIALDYLTATTTTYLANFIGFVTMAMSIFILREIPTIFQIVGAVTAVVGLTIFFEQAPTGYEFVGVILVLIGMVAVAYTNNIARKLAIITNFSISNNIISTTALMIGGTITVAIGLVLDWPPQVGGWVNWAIILYIGVVTVAVGLTLWNYYLRILRSYEASILGASTVIWTALLANLILGEQINRNQVVGIVLMIAGLLLVQVRRGHITRANLRRWRDYALRRPPAPAAVAPLIDNQPPAGPAAPGSSAHE